MLPRVVMTPSMRSLIRIAVTGLEGTTSSTKDDNNEKGLESARWNKPKLFGFGKDNVQRQGHCVSKVTKSK